MIYELRTYTPYPAKLQRLHRRFREVTLDRFAAHGMHVVGFWEAEGEREGERDLAYLLAFPDRETADAAWDAFRADDVWIRAKAASETDGPLNARIVSRWLEPTDYSPLR